jgi:Na+-driven multidrug efflux pump
VAGAAIATVLANAIAAAAVMWVVIFKDKIVAFSLPARDVLLQHWKEILHVGLPAMGSNAVNPVALIFVIAALAQFGTDVVAGYGAAGRIEAFAILPLFALSAAIGPMTGQNRARGFPDRVRESFRASFVLCVGWSLVMAVVLAVIAPFAAPTFLPDPDAQAAMRHYLWIVPISVWGYGIVIAASAGFNGMSKPVPGLAMTIGRSLVLMVGLAWLGGWFWRETGVFIGIAVANLISGGVVAFWTLTHALPKGAHEAPTPTPIPATPEPVILDAAATEH